MKKYLLLLLIGICAASCDSYVLSRLEPQVEEAWEDYNPYLWDIYKSYSLEERKDYLDFPDSIPFVTEKGDTMMVWPWAMRCSGEALIGGKNTWGGAGMNLLLYQDKDLYSPLAFLEIQWEKRAKKMEITTAMPFIQIPGCDSSRGSYVEKRYDDYLEFSNEEGDVYLLQKNVGIVRITCHDGRSWMPAR